MLFVAQSRCSQRAGAAGTRRQVGGCGGEEELRDQGQGHAESNLQDSGRNWVHILQLGLIPVLWEKLGRGENFLWTDHGQGVKRLKILPQLYLNYLGDLGGSLITS